MALISLVYIVKRINTTLSDYMVLKKRMVSALDINNPQEDELIKIQLELLKNSASTIANSYDASIVINDYCYAVGGNDHIIKLSIYARDYLTDDKINKSPPELEVTLHGINAKRISNYLTYPEITKLEEDLESAILQEWKKYV